MAAKQQIIIIQTLISKCKLRAQKENIVLGFSGGRTEHVSELTHAEANELIKYLRGMSERTMERDSDYARAEKMRRKIISLAHEMRWELPNGKINMKSVDAWCRKYSYLHKSLDGYTYKELPRLITQFQNGPYKHYISTLK